jgi:hypothetical protein
MIRANTLIVLIALSLFSSVVALMIDTDESITAAYIPIAVLFFYCVANLKHGA